VRPVTNSFPSRTNQTSKANGSPVGEGAAVGDAEGEPAGDFDGVATGLSVGEGVLPVGPGPRDPELFPAQPAANRPRATTRTARRFISFLLP
jgi:hypothetical protein